MFRYLLSRLKTLLRADRLDTEMDEEMAFHIERQAEDLMRQGLSPEEARRQARLRFGSTERAKERAREEHGLRLVDEGRRNLRFALRGMRRSPLFSITAVLTLALCIGAGAAVFSVVDAVLWKPLPYPHPQDLALVTDYVPSRDNPESHWYVDGRAWERIRDEAPGFQPAVYSDWTGGVNLSTPKAAAFVQQQRVGSGYFHTLGVPLELGREFTAAEDMPHGPRVAILSHRLWARTFGEDPDILGKVIRLKGAAYTVVGVLPASFHTDLDVWTPLRASTTGEGGGTNYAVLVRIPHWMSLSEARARFGAIETPRVGKSATQRRFGLVRLRRADTEDARLPMLILLGAIGLMLLIGCANLAGLQIARSLARRSEFATRQALGGGTGAMVRQIVTENVVLGALGGAAGLAAAWAGLGGLGALARSHFFVTQEIGMDGTVVAAAVVLTLLATVLTGLAPVLHAAKADAHGGLSAGRRGTVGGGSHLVRKLLLVGEVAMVTALLFSAGLLVRSYARLERLHPGFDPRGVLTVQFSLDDARYADADSVRSLFDETLTGIRAIPGVSAAAVALTLPYERPLNLPFRVRGGASTNEVTNAVYVTPGFFRAMHIPLLRGRALDEGDRRGTATVAVVNEAFVDRYLKGRSALGSRLMMGLIGKDGVEIVGVCGNVQQSAGWGSTSQPVWETPTLYVAAAQLGSGFLRQVHVWFSPSWIVRSSDSRADLAGAVTRVFRQVAPGLPVARMESLRAIMDQAFARPRFEAAFLLVVAIFALLLAGIGLYGIVAHEVLERRAEMGLRMALGATPGSAVWTAGTTGVRLTLFGLLAGTGLSVVAARLVAHLIWGVAPWDPLTLGVVLGVLALLALVASFVPAARVGRMDPATILREA